VAKKPNPRTVALNLISEHGQDGFQKLIDMFRDNISGTRIGAAFGVSRQRVSQWKLALGVEHVRYEVDAAIQNLVDQGDPKTLGRTSV